MYEAEASHTRLILPVTKAQIRKVLLVEDDNHIRLIIKTSLFKLAQWQVIEARNGAEALRLADEERPDLILLDIMMPGMDGTTTFKELQKNEAVSAVPVIFMTAKVQRQEIESYIKLGARGVITKPVDPMTLPEQIIDTLNKS
jgi:two-component system, OmpR family, response regulator